MSAIDHANGAAIYDNALRWSTPSRSDPHVIYVQELDSYSCNGQCDCPDFRFNFEKLLAQGISGPQALERGLVKLRDYQASEDDALRCWHLVVVRGKFATAVAASLAVAKRR